MCQAKQRSNKSRGPVSQSHTATAITDKIQRKLAASLDFEDFTSTYKAKMRVYGQVSALDTAEESNPVIWAMGKKHMGQPQYGHSDGSDDYAEPHACVSSPTVSSPGEQIYQSVMSIPGPVVSRSTLLSHGYSTSTNPYQQPIYQKSQKQKRYQQRSSSQNIYQSVNNCGSLSKFETYDSRVVPKSATPEVNIKNLLLKCNFILDILVKCCQKISIEIS